MKNLYVLITIGLFSLQVFAQGYSLMDTVYTPTGYPDGPLQATIYIPDSSNGIGVVLAHWWTGTRQTPHAWCEAFAANGYVAMTIDYYDYSFPANNAYPKPSRAYKTAVEFLRRNASRFGISTGKIVAFGQSEGSNEWGETIIWDNDDTFFGTDPLVDDHVDAAVLLYGMYDNEHFLQSDLNVEQILVSHFSPDPSLRATKGNCIANFTNINCPLLLFHGTNDRILQFQQSLALYDSMTAHHMNVELLSSNIWDHGFDVMDQSFNFTTEGLVAKDSALAFLRRELQPLSTSVNEPITHLYQFSLYQNYPNPFNPSTTISFSIPISEFVTLKVFDVLGNEVATLVNEEKPVGNYEVNFSAIGGSASGRNAYSLSSGIYFYKLQTGSFVETMKMILLK